MARPTKQKKGVSVRHSSEIAVGVSIKAFCSMFKQYSPATIYWHVMKPIGQKALFDAQQNNRRGPKILSKQDRHVILRAIPKLRKSCGSFMWGLRLELNSKYQTG